MREGLVWFWDVQFDVGFLRCGPRYAGCMVSEVRMVVG